MSLALNSAFFLIFSC